MCAMDLDLNGATGAAPVADAALPVHTTEATTEARDAPASRPMVSGKRPSALARALIARAAPDGVNITRPPAGKTLGPRAGPPRRKRPRADAGATYDDDPEMAMIDAYLAEECARVAEGGGAAQGARPPGGVRAEGRGGASEARPAAAEAARPRPRKIRTVRADLGALVRPMGAAPPYVPAAAPEDAIPPVGRTSAVRDGAVPSPRRILPRPADGAVPSSVASEGVRSSALRAELRVPSGTRSTPERDRPVGTNLDGAVPPVGRILRHLSDGAVRPFGTSSAVEDGAVLQTRDDTMRVAVDDSSKLARKAARADAMDVEPKDAPKAKKPRVAGGDAAKDAGAKAPKDHAANGVKPAKEHAVNGVKPAKEHAATGVKPAKEHATNGAKATKEHAAGGVKPAKEHAAGSAKGADAPAEKKKRMSAGDAGALVATIVDASRAGHGKAAGEFVRAWVRAALAKTLGVVASDADIAAYVVLLLQFCVVVRRTATAEAPECARVLRLWLGLIAAGDDALRGAVLRVLPAANAPKKGDDDDARPKVAAAWMKVASATELAADWAALVEELALCARAVQGGRVRDEGRAIDEGKLAAALGAAAATVGATKPAAFARFVHKMGAVPKDLAEPSADTIGLVVWAAECGATSGRDLGAAALAFGKCSDAVGRPARDARGGAETWARVLAAAGRGGRLGGDTASALLRDAMAALAARAVRAKAKKDAKKAGANKGGDKTKKAKEDEAFERRLKAQMSTRNRMHAGEKGKSGTAKAAGAAKAKRVH